MYFQAFHGLAVALVYKYADAIVKNFANSSVMALLIAISYYFFALQTNLHSASVEFSRPEAPANTYALQHAPPALNQARGGRQPQPASRIGRCVLAGRLASPALVPTQALVARSRHRAHHDLLLHEHRCKAAAPGRQLARGLEAGRSCKARRRGGRGLRRHQAARGVAFAFTRRGPVSAGGVRAVCCGPGRSECGGIYTALN